MTIDAPSVRSVRPARVAPAARAEAAVQPEAQPGFVESRRPQLTVVDPRSWRARRRRRIGWALCGLLALTMPFVAVTLNASMAQAQFRLDELRGQYSDAQQHYEELRARVAELSSPSRIVDGARELGMIDPARSRPVLQVPTPSGTTSYQPPADDTTLGKSWGESKTKLHDVP